MKGNRWGIVIFIYIVGGTIFAMLNAFDGEILPLIVIGSILVGFIVLWSDTLLGFGFFSVLDFFGDLFKKIKNSN